MPPWTPHPGWTQFPALLPFECWTRRPWVAGTGRSTGRGSSAQCFLVSQDQPAGPVSLQSSCAWCPLPRWLLTHYPTVLCQRLLHEHLQSLDLCLARNSYTPYLPPTADLTSLRKNPRPPATPCCSAGLSPATRVDESDHLPTGTLPSCRTHAGTRPIRGHSRCGGWTQLGTGHPAPALLGVPRSTEPTVHSQGDPDTGLLLMRPLSHCTLRGLPGLPDQSQPQMVHPLPSACLPPCLPGPLHAQLSVLT